GFYHHRIGQGVNGNGREFEGLASRASNATAEGLGLHEWQTKRPRNKEGRESFSEK
ncbi:MAG: hypothetical protein H7Y12_12905, partial [Sphingobacteriaceae bacterium]|nr:hypothetical protein [Cytophagaceae bacterium]